jgi:peptidoglycan/xylan/chitin deacetylase (PgdA/CDA1 family)
LLLSLISGSIAPDRAIAITVDDLPYATGELGGTANAFDAKAAENANRRILAALKAHRAPVTGFVIQKRAEELGLAVSTRVLRNWTVGDFDLANHSYSHRDADELSVSQIEEEIRRGEGIYVSLMKKAGKRPEFFRFPMNHTGDTKEKHDQVAAFLRLRGYRLAACTMENSDYLFNRAYVRMLAKHDAASAEKLRQEYITYTEAEIDYLAGLQGQVFGYEPAEMMLLHDNELNADTLEQILASFEKRRYRFISLGEAESGPAYQVPDTYTSKFGPMWGYRWAAELGIKVNGNLEPEPPDWVLNYR